MAVLFGENPPQQSVQIEAIEEEKEKMDDGAKIDNGEPAPVEQTLTEMIFGPNLAKHASVPAKRKK